MITRIRDVRRARKMTLQDVAERCQPATTPQTIGRLETGARTVSIAWLNRIAGALGVDAADLVELPERDEVPIVAVVDHDGVHEPRQRGLAVSPRPEPGLVAVAISAGVGDYRCGDELWCRRLDPTDFARALNCDVLVPRPGGRFLFGRLIGRDEGRLHLLGFGAGQRQTVVADPPWAAVASTLIRTLS